MAFIVCHARKIKTATGLLQVAKHNLRENVDYKKPPDWMFHPERSQFNTMSLEPETSQEIIKYRKELIAQAQLKRKPQKNAAAAIEFNLSASPDWFRDRKESESRKFLEDCTDFISKKYGQVQVLHCAMHFDEKTPHAHILCVPIVRNRYTSSEFLGGRDGLRNLQQEIYEKVGKKWGLERGFEGSKARHDDAIGYDKKLKKEFRTYLEVRDRQYPSNIRQPKFLERLTNNWEAEIFGIFHAEIEKASQYGEIIKKRENKLKQREATINAREKEITEREQKLDASEKYYQKVLRENKDMTLQMDKMANENYSLRSEVIRLRTKYEPQQERNQGQERGGRSR